ncbi:hypothetical protein BD289DRAFT_197081 [Coniella lustricola]|uniref:Uncharacterized protein n=1 Tax=Coniella lustricola TaxID=2025994 RepID=A0A2T3ACW8_9PEZI|nr:hypothetical protein BD289DRAFT_197081 [Coniella lustricola]
MWWAISEDEWLDDTSKTQKYLRSIDVMAGGGPFSFMLRHGGFEPAVSIARPDLSITRGEACGALGVCFVEIIIVRRFDTIVALEDSKDEAPEKYKDSRTGRMFSAAELVQMMADHAEVDRRLAHTHLRLGYQQSELARRLFLSSWYDTKSIFSP